MLYRKIFVLLLVYCSACVMLDEPEEHIGKTVQLVESSNILSANRLSSNRLSANRLSANRLSANRLSATRLALNTLDTEGMELTLSGREVLSYIARCALPAGEILETEVDSVVYHFPGLIGLAPGWEGGALTVSEQRWMTACLLAHCNYFGESVPISVRGPHPSLTTSTAERGNYFVQDGVFFGNIFADPPTKYACLGDDQIQGSSSPQLGKRVCSREDTGMPGSTYCGFTAVGACHEQSVGGSRACESYSSGAYEYFENCHPTPSNGTWSGDSPFVEVITAFVPSI